MQEKFLNLFEPSNTLRVKILWIIVLFVVYVVLTLHVTSMLMPSVCYLEHSCSTGLKSHMVICIGLK